MKKLILALIASTTITVQAAQQAHFIPLFIIATAATEAPQNRTQAEPYAKKVRTHKKKQINHHPKHTKQSTPTGRKRILQPHKW